MQNNFNIYNFYQKRDLIYKCQAKSAYSLPKISKIIALQSLEKKENIFSCISSFILLFERMPFVIQVKKTLDKKLKKTIIGVKHRQSLNNFFNFFFRIKSEEKQNSLEKHFLLLKKYETFSIRFNIFDEFLFLYDKFLNLSTININFFYANCKTNEEKALLLSNLIFC